MFGDVKRRKRYSQPYTRRVLSTLWESSTRGGSVCSIRIFCLSRAFTPFHPCSLDLWIARVCPQDPHRSISRPFTTIPRRPLDRSMPIVPLRDPHRSGLQSPPVSRCFGSPSSGPSCSGVGYVRNVLPPNIPKQTVVHSCPQLSSLSSLPVNTARFFPHGPAPSYARFSL